MESKRSKRYYSQDYKVEIVKRCVTGESSKEVARAIGISSRLIRNWITRYNTFGEDG